jgi:hypothetical protein
MQSELPAQFIFIPTGSHQNLSASTTTTFFVQVRCYLDKTTGTSPRMSEQDSKYLIRIFSPCKTKKLYPTSCNDSETSTCVDNPNNKKCPNDLVNESINDGKKADDLSAAVCGKFRLDKTTEKTTLTALQWAIVASITILIICILIYQFVYKINSILFIPPLIVLIVVLVIIRIKYVKYNNTTAYDVSQSLKQNK